MKIISWNVNGIRAILNKGFCNFVQREEPDIICIQEIKAQREQVEELLPNYPYQYWNSAVKKGYAGTAIFSKIEPLQVISNMGKEEHDQEGRIIALEFKEFYLVTVYVPNSQRGLIRLDYRQKWNQDFCAYLKQLEKKKPLLICGDLNVAHTEIDLANPKENYNVTAGFTQAEIDGFENLLAQGFVDTFRKFNPNPGHYTYWSYMFNARQKNIGWRIDYFLTSKSFLPNVEKSFILPEVWGSDHCPIGLLLKFPEVQSPVGSQH